MNKLKSILSAVGGVLLGLFGRMSVPIYILIGCNVIDYITGILSAKARGEKVTSYQGVIGIAKKICMWLLVVVGWIVDLTIAYAAEPFGLEIELKCTVAFIVCLWLTFNELISILENISQIGVPIPSFLIKVVKWMENTTEKTGDSIIPEGGQNVLDDK